MNIKNVIRLEEFVFVLFAIYLFSMLDYVWWWFVVLFLVPDLTWASYLAGPRIGAIVYNLVHHRGLAIGAYILGAILGVQVLQLIGLIMLAHSSLDRVFGYGLKLPDAFTSTHLGLIGAAAKGK